MSDALSRMLASKRVILADGATGSHLALLAESIGEKLSKPCECLNLDKPELVRNHYREYVEAGSDLLLTNTWAANRLALERAGVQASRDEIRQINKAGAEILREVISESGRECVCAGAVGPTGWIVHAPEDDGAMNAKFLDLPFADAEEAFTDQIQGLVEGGVDVIWIESQIAPHEVRAAVGALRSVSETLGKPAAYALSMVFNSRGRTELEYDIDDFIREFGYIEGGPVAIGFNCGFGPEVPLALIAEHRQVWQTLPPLFIKANCGSSRRASGTDKFVPAGMSDEQMGRYAQLAVDYGVRIVGGCCGTFPRHIQAMRAALENYSPHPPPETSKLHELLGLTN